MNSILSVVIPSIMQFPPLSLKCASSDINQVFLFVIRENTGDSFPCADMLHFLICLFLICRTYVTAIDDCAKDAVEEFFSKMHCV